MGAWGNHDAAVIKTYLNSMIKGDSGLEVYANYFAFTINCEYRKIASSRVSRLVAHFQIFRRLMKGNLILMYCDL